MAAILNRGSYIFGLPGNLLTPSGGKKNQNDEVCSNEPPVRDFFLKPGTHAGQNPNIINSSPLPPILNSKSAGESPGHHLGKSTRPMLQKPFLHAVSTYVRASDFIMFSLKGKLTQTERRGNSGIVS